MKKDVNAIIFDFGNVIINIDVQKTYDLFAKYCFKTPKEIEEIFTEAQLFRRYESGNFEDDEFREIVRQTIGFPINNREIDLAWNALLLDVPYDRLKIINALKNDYEVYLLSNTNSIHIKKCLEIFTTKYGIKDFLGVFDKAFLSYEMGMWKPDDEIYLKVLETINKEPNQVLFLDDNANNIKAAKKLGINTKLITKEKGVEELFPEYLHS